MWVGSKPALGPEVTEAEELDRVVSVVAGLVARALPDPGLGRHLAGLGGPGLVQRGRADGQRHQRVRRPRRTCPPRPSTAGGSVVATHIRLAPRVADPDPHYDDVVVGRGPTTLTSGPSGPVGSPACPPSSIVLDAGLDLGKTAAQSLTLLRASSTVWPASATRSSCPPPTRSSSVVIARFGVDRARPEASLGAARPRPRAWGCRDPAGARRARATCRVRDVLDAVLAARRDALDVADVADVAQ